MDKFRKIYEICNKNGAVIYKCDCIEVCEKYCKNNRNIVGEIKTYNMRIYN